MCLFYFFDLRVDLVVVEFVCNFANLDLRRAALFGWINLTLAALSNAEKAAVKPFSVRVLRAALTKLFRVRSRVSLRAVLILSFRTFLIADLINGI